MKQTSILAQIETNIDFCTDILMKTGNYQKLVHDVWIIELIHINNTHIHIDRISKLKNPFIMPAFSTAAYLQSDPSTRNAPVTPTSAGNSVSAHRTRFSGRAVRESLTKQNGVSGEKLQRL
ncbi:hypothetical protein JTB14_019162 [Gonioctena quinquepunctata]|nr:hypothetical protein JTB14_019162 [Gonioctena quinquepunctata]